MKDLSKMSESERLYYLAQRAYKAAWRAKNKDKVKATQERFYMNQAKKLLSDVPNADSE